MPGLVTVAIPVRNGGRRLVEVLDAVRGQRSDREVEIVVVDSASTDGSADAARAAGARVEVIAPGDFSHGGTRNRLMELARGEYVVFLTQDAVPAGEDWLECLLAGFALADDVALVCGPYIPLPGTSLPVVRELRDWFALLSPDGAPRIDRNTAARGPGPEAFFTDANGAVARWAWERVPFRSVPYAEDQALAIDMLRAGFAKAFVPDAAVVHSHEYRPLAQFRRTFDEFRGLREVHGWIAPLVPVNQLRGQLGADWRELRARGLPPRRLARESVRSLRHWTVRAAGAAAGSRADRLPPGLRRLLSLERRGSFEPLEPGGSPERRG
jgi:glycosyltransferase involved in cell wall biosynthesis